MKYRTCSKMKLFGVLVTEIFLFSLLVNGEEGDFTNEWAVEIDGGDEVAEQVARENNFIIINKIFDNVFHLKHQRLARRSIQPSDDHHLSHHSLTSHPKVRWAEQQVVRRRIKRDVYVRSSLSSAPKTLLDDPKWPNMWYLNRGGALDMNVQKAWDESVTGKGVVVTILDDGLEKDHPDIIKNYDPNASYDVNGFDPDPMPRYDLVDSNRHGTRCAGEVAADANNSICAVGVAYEASIGGVRMLDGDVTDAVEAKSLALNPQHIDIYSASWGPDDDGKTVDGPGQLATRAFTEGITNGRHGKGSIFVWASGNGGRDQDNCNCDGYTNSIWTLSISSSTEKGRVPWYSEACSSTLATTYSSGSLGERQIITTDLHHSCTSSHTGTSASAPLAAGICALALQVNTNMTWRDMQHIVVRTARPDNLEAPDWQTNGAGRHVSHRFGYGLMDAHAMVQLARNWTTVPKQRKCEDFAPHLDKLIPQKSFVTLTLEVNECPGVNFLEHVQAKVTLTADRRGDIEIYLTSPAGTKSTLLAQRPHDNSHTGFHSWPFMTVHMWGEKPFGIWKLEIHNNGHFFPFGKATIKEWRNILHGTESEPGSVENINGNGATRDDIVSIGDMDNNYHHDPKKGSTEEREKQEFPPGEASRSGAMSSPPTPIPVLLHLSSSPSEPAPPSHFRQGCTNMDSSGACLVCNSTELILHNGECISSCPKKFYLLNPDNTSVPLNTRKESSCRPCHYTCWSCQGPLDYQCIQCWGDAVLYSPNKDETFCHSQSLVRSYSDHQWWTAVTVILLVIMLLLLVLLVIFMIRSRKLHKSYVHMNAGHLGTKNKVESNNRTPYARVPINDSERLMTKIPFHDLSSDTE